jgi:transposase InsO family protein
MPRLNGKVERVQRTVQEELWDGVDTRSLSVWQRQLQVYVRYYNCGRLHSALQGKTPWEYVHQRLAQVGSSLS